MLNKLERFARQWDMVHPGETVACAVSGGADSVALLYALYLLREKWGITLEAAHFNHHLRGAESDRDEEFVRKICDRLELPLHVGGSQVEAGKKGLEAAAREARYAYLETLPGKIATAHTADDNAETVLMRMVRGTGLKGLGAIAPVSGRLIRPMLTVTRREVEQFLEEHHMEHMEDSSNESDAFLRNRVRRQIMPLLKEENPCLAGNLSAMALRLRQDEQLLDEWAAQAETTEVQALRVMHPALRSRVLEQFLKKNSVSEPTAEHISLMQALVFSEKPSAGAQFPGGVVIGREYGCLVRVEPALPLEPTPLHCPGVTELPALGLRVVCEQTDPGENRPTAFSVAPTGQMILRSRMEGDRMRFPGGTKSLKKWFVDEKIPAARRNAVPVIADGDGVLGVYGGGGNLDRAVVDGQAVRIRFEEIVSQSAQAKER